MRQHHFDDSPIWGLCSTLVAILSEVITVSGIFSTVFYSALGVIIGWTMNAVRNQIKKNQRKINKK